MSDDLNQPVDRPAAAQFNDILLNLAVRVANAPQQQAWGAEKLFQTFRGENRITPVETCESG